MEPFLDRWAESALTSVAWFWRALWAFVLGYSVSSLIQVFVTPSRIRRAMGETGPRSVAVGTVFGFVSSSCSFAALATTRTLFQKGAGLVPALAFLLASTNLVIELGFVIAVFLSWQFVVGEYVGGLLLILFVWGFVALTRPAGLIDQARAHGADDQDDGDDGPAASWRERIRTLAAWRDVARHYAMEWGMVAKDVTIGFAVAGVISVFVPRSFFETLFPGGGSEAPWTIAIDALVGPVAAFCTFIGSMGNVPLAGVLYEQGVSFAGVMAFLFSDLVVLPVLRIQIRYYGWRLALYIAAAFLAALVVVSVVLHLGFDALGLLPHAAEVVESIETDGGPRFAGGTTAILNLVGLAVTGAFWWLMRGGGSAGPEEHHDHHHGGHGAGDAGSGLTVDGVIAGVAWLAVAWVAVGVALALLR